MRWRSEGGAVGTTAAPVAVGGGEGGSAGVDGISCWPPTGLVPTWLASQPAGTSSEPLGLPGGACGGTSGLAGSGFVRGCLGSGGGFGVVGGASGGVFRRLTRR